MTSQLKIIPHKVRAGLVRLSNIKNIIAVTSGKGGVGKSTTAFNLAIALNKMGAKVGLLDADIYGPSIPILVGERDYKLAIEDACFKPLLKFDLQIISFGFLIKQSQPVVWRGAMVNKALEQLLFDSKWDNVDYLIVDMPPGTGDIHLTMCQKMPITAIVTVTTPQDLALQDVIRSVEMYQKMTIPCLGVIENMSTHTCAKCGNTEDIFGASSANRLQSEYNLEILGKLPLNIAIRQSSDNGIICEEFIANYQTIAAKLSNNLQKLPKDYSTQIGKVKTL